MPSSRTSLRENPLSRAIQNSYSLCMVEVSQLQRSNEPQPSLLRILHLRRAHLTFLIAAVIHLLALLFLTDTPDLLGEGRYGTSSIPLPSHPMGLPKSIHGLTPATTIPSPRPTSNPSNTAPISLNALDLSGMPAPFARISSTTTIITTVTPVSPGLPLIPSTTTWSNTS
jgi:hypothetical protein